MILRNILDEGMKNGRMDHTVIESSLKVRSPAPSLSIALIHSLFLSFVMVAMMRDGRH